MSAPILTKPIPQQMINERAAYGPVDLKKFVQLPSAKVQFRFRAEVKGGAMLPKGLICTSDGILTGIPAAGTQGSYEVNLNVETEEGLLQTTFVLIIKPNLSLTNSEYFDKLKNQVWEALNKNLPLPDLGEMFERPIN